MKPQQQECNYHTSLGNITQATEKIESIKDGGRRIFSALELDLLTNHPLADFLKTCINKQQIGLRDQYLGWIDDRSKPFDLEYKEDGYAYGTHSGS
jgi:hypothetical protein